MAVPVEAFFLDPHAQGTLQVRIQQMIAQGILSGRLQQGEKLPSTRSLAAHLGVSRITVTLAYTELVANDYLTARGRSGFYVSASAPAPPPAFDGPAPAAERVDWDRALGQRFTRPSEVIKPRDWNRYKYPFVYGQADPRLFDHANWRLCALRALGAADFHALTGDYYDQDDPELIAFIARHTLPRRGIQAQPQEILVTLGAQNALWLAVQVLLTRDRLAVMEDPGYPALRDMLQQAGCRLAPVAVDAQGLPPAALPAGTDVIFTTPSHQAPTSATMPIARRHALLDRARALDALIVEDDYEFEMAYPAAPQPALKSLDRDGRVIYVGSFSKSLFPGLRLGYLVGDKAFIREARSLRASVLRHPPGHVQRTTAHFLALGHYDALMRRQARALHARREAMEAALAAETLEIAGLPGLGGSSFWMRAPEGIDTLRLFDRLQRQSVLIEPGHNFFAGPGGPRNYYRLGYSSIPVARIAEGVALIAAALDAETADAHRE